MGVCILSCCLVEFIRLPSFHLLWTLIFLSLLLGVCRFSVIFLCLALATAQDAWLISKYDWTNKSVTSLVRYLSYQFWWNLTSFFFFRKIIKNSLYTTSMPWKHYTYIHNGNNKCDAHRILCYYYNNYWPAVWLLYHMVVQFLVIYKWLYQHTVLCISIQCIIFPESMDMNRLFTHP